MKKVLLLALGSWLLALGSTAQNVSQRLQKAFQQFEADSQLKHAMSSLYVINAKTGEVVFDKNSQVGLAGASTQKIVTAATAFELLGKDYRYKTDFIHTVRESAPFFEELTIQGHGDPTLGSWRYLGTKPENILNAVTGAFKKAGVLKINGPITAYNNFFQSVNIPGGWIWEDIGNYYGAGATELNWKENQFDLWMKPGKKAGDSVFISPIAGQSYRYINEVSTGEKNSGDNAYIYYNPSSPVVTVRGTIPCCVDSFKISGASINPSSVAVDDLYDYLRKSGIQTLSMSMFGLSKDIAKRKKNILYTHYSPSLDSLIYWFLKKSINLYGEALVKTFAYEKQGFGSTDSGVNIVRKFWKEKGLDEDELNIYDGSGLSPLNRLTTHAQVEILKYAKTRDWFPYFYDALPEYNGMKLKSGTISDVKGFCGYHTAKDGTQYIVSFLVNNYNGRTSGVVNKMYKVLDELK